MLKSERHYFYHTFLSLSKEISTKNYLLVVSEISNLFPNILTPDDKYSLLVKANVWRHHFKCNYLKIKKYLLIFFLISAIEINLKYSEKKDEYQIWFPSEIIDSKKGGLLKCLKGPMSEYLLTVNMLKCAKDSLNLHGSIFVIFLDHSERKWARKILF